ncbi:glycosyltransferase family 2 protein [[Clostridium] scindens]|uniref:glycosyltransferase family 2 protein n=1 Tax=Clostridium scindens (strain JCM 10418 / VPI 12708) TaxID=29347 RepID=UPI0022E40D2A|nr:glycosyltransferase family 2 protein [[Clostridium] scindens]
MDKEKERLVTVIVAIYNVEKYLDKCISSICAQTYRNLQIILIDDGSEDNSGNICDLWERKDKRIFVFHKKNRGVSNSRNLGIEHANGQYVVFVDSDDRLELNFVEILINAHNTGNLSVVGYYIDCEINNKVSSKKVVYGKKNEQKLDNKDAVSLYSKGLLSVVWNKLYEKEILDRYNVRFKEELSLGEDILFNLSYISVIQGGFDIINCPLYHYFKRGNVSLDRKYRENYSDIQKIIFKSFLNYWEKIKGNEEQRQLILQFYFNALIVAIDNLYLNRNKMDQHEYKSRKHNRICDPEMMKLLSEMKGKRKFISAIRWFMIFLGMHKVDFYIRLTIKRILRLE